LVIFFLIKKRPKRPKRKKDKKKSFFVDLVSVSFKLGEKNKFHKTSKRNYESVAAFDTASSRLPTK
jgi:hypothetical protein